jgi:ribonucleoside-diphosphate reductase alpha chain
MCRFLKDQGVPNEPDVTKPKHTTVFSFPKRSPEGAVCTKDMTAIDQLEMWKVLADEWCDHNPSTTIQVKEDEWVGVFSWMYNEWDSICGIALLPYSEHTYQQAPYQEISKEEYEEAMAEMPSIDWWVLGDYEVEDGTTGQHDLACSGGVCEVVDIS